MPELRKSLLQLVRVAGVLALGGPAHAGPYSVSLYEYVTGYYGENTYGPYNNLSQFSYGAGSSASYSLPSPYGLPTAATATGTTTVGIFDASASASNTGGFGTEAIAEESFTDELTITGPIGVATTLLIEFNPNGGSVSTPFVASTTAQANMNFTLNAGGSYGSASITENVCDIDDGVEVSSCGGDTQAAPSEMYAILNTEGGDTVQLTANIYVEANAAGNTYDGLEPAAASSDFANALVVITPQSGFGVISASGASYDRIPEPSTMVLLATAIIVLLGYARRAALNRTDVQA